MRQVHRQIQWFPGHMNKTRRLIEEQINRIDIVVEILDARVPQASRNPLLEEITAEKPVLLVLNKSDLAESELTAAWIKQFEASGYHAAAVTSTEPKTVTGILSRCRQIAEKETGKSGNKVNVLVAGVPNVGKSTIINALKKEKKTSVQNKPGHTRDFQRIVVSNTMTLIDTPGILWHKFEPETGFRLAVMGCIKDSILDSYMIASAALLMLRNAYPDRLASRYNLEEDDMPLEEEALIELIGRSRGMIRKGGVVDFERACNIIIREIRDGKLGRMSFESPDPADSRYSPDIFSDLQISG
ncbi:MAG: ribosome biogenesis GTPase YlqF [Spirochaetales bacterium]|uniref:Ribosome biogenesis GTPase A n=1 Tax=Candidatus Thalassospirochaeta sargassi TaxID=3119039 RepID=A0AAJ1IAX2_9SPIO|nr:ribosome biogenesis GTPase YlqF [Spirochaetales bacterium]